MKKLVFSIYHFVWSFCAAVWYGFPSKKMTVIGVTGTKGKSTTLSLLARIFEKSGRKTALLSSVYIKIGNETKKNLTGNTMPGRFFIQRFLSRAVKAGCQIALLEITSQGVVQHRHRFIWFDGAVFLGIHPEHIEAHGSFEKYLEAKVSFFRFAAEHAQKHPRFFVNEDDSFSRQFQMAAGDLLVKNFSAQNISAEELNVAPSLLGDFNRINVAAAGAVADSFGVKKEIIRNAVATFPGLPGRTEMVQETPFLAMVDYAHTPDSLSALYSFLSDKKKKDGGKLICILGACGGGRDRWKRPEMGKIASFFCDVIVLADEDPYDEKSELILDEIEKGIDADKHRVVFKIMDRRRAIEKAVSLARAGDAVIATGKGSESFIHLAKGKKMPWSESEELTAAIRKESALK